MALTVTMLMAAGCGGTDARGTGSGVQELARATGEPEIHKLKVGALPITDLKQLYVADAEGFFQEEGLEVEIENFEGGAAIAPAVESGSVHIGWSNSISILQARARGLEFRFFAGGLYQGPGHWTSAIMVPKDSPIRRPKQLRGHNVAMNTLANINELVMRVYLTAWGWRRTTPSSSRYRSPTSRQHWPPVGWMARRLPSPSSPWPSSKGARVIEAQPFAAIGPEPFVAAFFATDDWLRDNPNTAAAFRRAVNKATRYRNDHPEQRAEIIAHYTGVPSALARRIGDGEPRTEIREQDIQAQIELSHDYRLLPRSFDAREVLARCSPPSRVPKRRRRSSL